MSNRCWDRRRRNKRWGMRWRGWKPIGQVTGFEDEWGHDRVAITWIAEMGTPIPFGDLPAASFGFEHSVSE